MPCKGTTKSGKPCGMRPSSGSEFCLNHGKASKSSTSSTSSAPSSPPAKTTKKSDEGLSPVVATLVGLAVGGLALGAWLAFGSKKPAATVTTLRAVS
jgi:hypothetical protein